jgi:hypothetical protein
MIPSGYPYDTHWVSPKKVVCFFYHETQQVPIGTHWVSQPYTHQGVCAWDFGLVCCVTNSSDMSQSRSPRPHGHEQTLREQ